MHFDPTEDHRKKIVFFHCSYINYISTLKKSSSFESCSSKHVITLVGTTLEYLIITDLNNWVVAATHTHFTSHEVEWTQARKKENLSPVDIV